MYTILQCVNSIEWQTFFQQGALKGLGNPARYCSGETRDNTGESAA